MKKIKILINAIVLLILLYSNGFSAKLTFFEEGKIFFDKKEFDKSKFFFEKDIVFNPKNEKSYLYLAKIFNLKDKAGEEENNLNSVLILNPKNDEAIYMLSLIKIKQSNYNEAKELIKKFELVCNLFCDKKSEINNKLSKITPDDKDNN
jgi:tetratricopeptide (TPR) repeat protein